MDEEIAQEAAVITGWPVDMHGMHGVATDCALTGSKIAVPFVVRVSNHDVYVVFLSGRMSGNKVHYSWVRQEGGVYPALTPAPPAIKR